MGVEQSRLLLIKEWSPEDRPREKLLRKGTFALSDAELIAILLGSGTTKLSAVELARKVMLSANNDLDQLARLSAKELMKVRGIGEAKAISICAAIELGRRRRESAAAEKPRVNGSKEAFEILQGEMMDLPNEEFWVLLMNRANRLVRKKRISEGGVSGTVVDPKIIFKLAIEELASSIIVAHNHPSGNLTASQADIDLTRKLRDGGRLLEVQLLDHIIVAGRKYLSFADEGIL